MKKVIITQDLCRMVELMMKGGAEAKEISERMGISRATVSRIKSAGFDVEQYRKNTTERVEKENQAEEQKTAPAEEQVPGQVTLIDYLTKDTTPKAPENTETPDNTKMMRFQAGQIGKVIEKLDKITDYLAQILRKMDG